MKKESVEIDRQGIYAEILEWLYTNDGAYDSALDWREAFNQLLREVILEEVDLPTDCICELCK